MSLAMYNKEYQEEYPCEYNSMTKEEILDIFKFRNSLLNKKILFQKQLLEEALEVLSDCKYYIYDDLEIKKRDIPSIIDKISRNL